MVAFTSVRCYYVRSVRPNKYRVEYYGNQHSNTGTAAERRWIWLSLLRDIRVGEDESDNSECELPVAKLTQLKTVLKCMVVSRESIEKYNSSPRSGVSRRTRTGFPDAATEVLLVRRARA